MTRILGPLATATCALMLLPHFVYNKKTSGFKYIYQITPPLSQPTKFMEWGQHGFLRNNCKFKNCYVTSNESLLKDVQLFDAVLFNARDLRHISPWDRPRRRRLAQKFVLVSVESAHYYPMCNTRWHGYFNWTWTYRLDSDVVFPYVAVWDAAGRVVAPGVNVEWLPHKAMAPVPAKLQDILRQKRVAAAWLVSNCIAASERLKFFKQLQQELVKFGLTVEVWGRCGRGITMDPKRMARLIQRRHYFYLAFENSFSDDYITEKVLHGMFNYAVPVMYGGANYSRFLPPHSYIDAIALGAAGTARLMRDLIANPSQYAEYHRWRSHYVFYKPSESADTDPHCRVCELLNSDQYRITTVYQDISVWWHGKLWNGSLPNTC